MRALFKLKNLLYDSTVSVKTSLKLFDQLIKPICLYGSEIWGFECLKKPERSKIFSEIEKVPCEKVHISFCRFILGVHRKSQLSAIRGELGRTPIAIEVIANVSQYYKYLQTKESGSLLKCALQSDKEVESSGIIKSWYASVLKMNDHLSLNGERSRKHMLRQLRSDYSRHWWDKIQLESKMRIFTQFKSHFEFEDYLNISNVKHRKAMTRLRISAHRLAIERGRYNNIPIEDRVCTTCQGRILEDEYHFLMICNKYDDTRRSMMNAINDKCDHFKHLSDYDKFIYLLSAGCDIAAITANFIHKCLP